MTKKEAGIVTSYLYEIDCKNRSFSNYVHWTLQLGEPCRLEERKKTWHVLIYEEPAHLNICYIFGEIIFDMIRKIRRKEKISISFVQGILPPDEFVNKETLVYDLE